MKILTKLKSDLYRKGFRPKQGSIFFSPSLAMMYSLRDTDIVGAFTAGFNKGLADTDSNKKEQ